MFTFLIAFTATAPRAQGTAVRAETFSLRPGGEVVVENARGATRVETWDSQTVRVLVEKTSAGGASIEPGELVLMGAQNSVIVQCKQGSGHLDLTLYVPHGAQVQVTGGAWPVDIAGVLSNAIVETTSGNIVYRIPSNDDARVSISSALGTVRSTIQLTAAERNGLRSLRGQMGSGLAQVTLNSQSGNVLLSPAPNSPAAAKASINQRREADDSSSIGASSTAVTNEVHSGSTPVRDSSARNKQNGNNTPSASQTVQSNSSVDFAGSDQSVDSSSTTTSGPFVRPRRERDTSSGGSGLKVHIIPSDSLPRGSHDVGAPGDQANDASGKTVNPSVSSNSPSGYNNGNSSASGSIDFAGSDRADSGTSNSRVGPLERDRQKRTTSGGDAGLRVRIIPANSQPPRSRDSNPIDDQQSANTSQPSTIESTPDTRARENAPPYGYSQRKSDMGSTSVERDGDLPFDRTSSRTSRESAPVLRRNDTGDTSGDSSATESRTGGGEDAVVLKAALVSLNVSVTNRAGVALANLKKEDFQIAENGETQKIEFFQPSTAPFNLVLLLDLSGSIKDKLDVVKSAALRFIDVLGPQDKVAVVTFTDEIRVISQLTADREELKRRIRAIDQSRGGTAFYEAVWFSLTDTLRGTRGQRNAIVVMSDGVDSSLDRYNPMESRVSFNQLARRLEEADVIVFPIYLDTEYEEVFERGNSSSEAYAISRDQLERIAEVSGGQMFKAEKVSDLAGVYKQVAAAMRTVYSVGYYPTNAEKDGTFRKVRVLVDRPDAAVRARKGYYAK
jgi:VWFA-related protein